MPACTTKQAIYSVDALCGIQSLKHGHPEIQGKIQAARIWKTRAQDAGESTTTLDHIEAMISYYADASTDRHRWSRGIYSASLNAAIVYFR